MKPNHTPDLFIKRTNEWKHRLSKRLCLLSMFILPLMSYAQWDEVGSADSIPDSCFSTACFKLTADAMNNAGAVWNSTMIDLSRPFVLTYTANFGTKDFTGGEGMAFVFHRDTRGTAAIGGNGGFLGYASFTTGQITPSVAIEFDTRQTGGGEVSYDHISLVVDADIQNPITTVGATPDNSNIEDGACHRIRVIWDPLNKVLSTYFDGVLRLADTINMPDSLGGDSVYWGITGSTGGPSNYQFVCFVDESSCCGPCGSNLVDNGDFSGPCNTGYTSELNYEDCDNVISIGDGGYTEATDASLLDNDWKGTDHTGNGSRILVIDGPTDENKVAWAQEVPVIEGESYCFSAWVNNICWDDCAPTTLEIRVGGETGALIGAKVDLEYTLDGTMLCGTYTAEATGNVELDIVIHKGEFIGNDAGVDDISFRANCSECCEYDIVIDEPDSTGAGCSGTVFFGIWDFLPPGCDLHAIVFDPGQPSSLCARPGYTRGYCVSYCLAPGQNKTFTGYVINSEGDTLCTLQKTVSCPEVIDCCDGFTVELREDEDNPFATCCMNYYVYRNECIGCDSIYTIRDAQGDILLSTLFSPIQIPPQGSAGLKLDTICCGIAQTCSDTDTLRFFDINGNLVCEKPVTGECTNNKTSREGYSPDTPGPDFVTGLRPNPAGNFVEMTYALGHRGPVYADLLTSEGKFAFTIVNQVQDEGQYRERIDTHALPNGIYFLRVFYAGKAETHRLIIHR